MKVNKVKSLMLKPLLLGVILYLGMISWGLADIYINVVAVNAKDEPRTSTIHFDLPGELTPEDILDTNGLQLDYNVDDASYFVHGDVTLKPKESKTFRIHVKDRWMVTPDNIADLKKQIDQGYQTLGVPYNAKNADILKDRLYSKIDYIVNLQTNSADSTDKRIDNYRAYAKEMKRMEDNALDEAYWRSDPGADEQLKLIHLTLQVENPTKYVKHFKHKDYLPEEVKPEDVVEAETFEVRYDQIKRLAFLFKEEDLDPGQKKKYSIGIVDIWNIDQKDINYLRARAQQAYGYLQGTNFEDNAKILMDRITADLSDIEKSQAVQRSILAHISVYRANKSIYKDAEKDVEILERLLSVFRENLTKSKIENILNKIQALKGVGDVAKTVFSKKFASSTAWGYISWILIFVGLLTMANFVVWLLRSKDKDIKDDSPDKDKLNK